MLALFPDVFPDACLISGCVSGCLPCARLCYLASGGSKISKKTRPLGSALLSCLRRVKDLNTKTPRETQTHTYIYIYIYIYIAFSPYSPISAPYRPLFPSFMKHFSSQIYFSVNV